MLVQTDVPGHQNLKNNLAPIPYCHRCSSQMWFPCKGSYAKNLVPNIMTMRWQTSEMQHLGDHGAPNSENQCPFYRNMSEPFHIQHVPYVTQPEALARTRALCRLCPPVTRIWSQVISLEVPSLTLFPDSSIQTAFLILPT